MSTGKFSSMLFSAIVALGAYLLFQLEPLVGKIVTPAFGGTAGVWSVLLLFFQLVIVAGYAITYGLSRMAPLAQAMAYCVLALAATVYCWVLGQTPWTAGDPAHPEMGVLSQLASHIALPAAFLATVSGMMQIWYRRATGLDPYHLYSYSNAGSVLALLMYPVFVEPFLTIATTQTAWRIALTTLAVLCVLASMLLRRVGEGAQAAGSDPPPVVPDGVLQSSKKSWRISYKWLLLSAIPAALLLSLTGFITQDVAPVPLLWIPPLAIYLLTFILAFSGRCGIARLPLAFCGILLAASFPALDFEMVRISLIPQVILCLFFLFSACMMCHLQLYRDRPPAEELPYFYLIISIGGALGGLAVSLIAPATINVYLEHGLLLLAVIGTGVMILNHEDFDRFRSSIAGQVLYPLLIALAFISVMLTFMIQHGGMTNSEGIQTERNFYGTVRIVRKRDRLELYHGHILHGLQYTDPLHQYEPASYYKDIVDTIEESTRATLHRPLNIGIIGLGVGTMAAWARPGDKVTFYELDPKIERIARTRFSFLAHSAAPPQVILGDARQSLTSGGGTYDFLFIDAFNGDSIPIHLLTKEAFELYDKHLFDDGVIVFHTSNHYLELAPVIAAAAKDLGMQCAYLVRDNIRYVVLTKNHELIPAIVKAHHARPNGVTMEILEAGSIPAWRDDYSNILSVLTWR